MAEIIAARDPDIERAGMEIEPVGVARLIDPEADVPRLQDAEYARDM